MRSRLDRALLAAAAALLTACASPPAPPPGGSWSGRLALTVAVDPPQRWSAAFELEGDAERGVLRLFGPLGNLAAEVRWSPQGAWLERGDGPAQYYPDLATLTTDLTGTALPVATLFDWLAGRPTPLSGWEVDLGNHASGRLHARRLTPAPPADLRLLWQP
ncbi:outer membrane lipoprotein LolB [Tepidimonas sp.]|uniref:outer membrane lipoprotein LolB n=1 Tax=Tepidimonas sp. TaxID=2002775 RepID=UPI002FDF9F8A